MATYEPMAGEEIGRTAEKMVAMATAKGERITADFNDIALTADPGDRAADIVAYYHRESDRRAEEYRTSPKYAADQERARLRQEAKDAACKAARATAPAHMDLRDPAAWRLAVDANRDAYGRGVIEYAERWARIMEARMGAGAALAEIADEASHVADNEGITGFMYGCAVQVLASCWRHGEELRRWHNRNAQIGDEGERANESGGVLNPALLTITPRDGGEG